MHASVTRTHTIKNTIKTFVLTPCPILTSEGNCPMVPLPSPDQLICSTELGARHPQARSLLWLNHAYLERSISPSILLNGKTQLVRRGSACQSLRVVYPQAAYRLTMAVLLGKQMHRLPHISKRTPCHTALANVATTKTIHPYTISKQSSLPTHQPRGAS